MWVAGLGLKPKDLSQSHRHWPLSTLRGVDSLVGLSYSILHLCVGSISPLSIQSFRFLIWEHPEAGWLESEHAVLWVITPKLSHIPRAHTWLYTSCAFYAFGIQYTPPAHRLHGVEHTQDQESPEQINERSLLSIRVDIGKVLRDPVLSNEEWG